MSAHRIIFVSPYDPRDIRKWSGTIYSLYQALIASDASVIYLSGGLLDLGARVVNKLCERWFKLDCRFSTAYAVLGGVYFTVRLALAGDAVIVAVAASNYLPYVATRKSIIYISDATFSTIQDLYPSFRAFPRWLQAQGDRNEAISLRKARFVLYPSRWAADSARIHYDVPADRITEIPFGPNIPADLIEAKFATKRPIAENGITLLFVTTDWERKNGELVAEVCQRLVDRGVVKLRLILIGEAPDRVVRLPFIDAWGRLSKTDPAQMARLCQAYAEAHLLLLPTRAEAFGVVFSEAQAFGVPSITYDVGGTGSAVVQGETGILLPLSADAMTFAAAIEQCVGDPDLYEAMSLRCRERYLRHANWTAWADLISRLAQISA